MTQNSYNTIAPHYNWIMEHVDYTAWAQYIESVCRHFKLQPRKILELGAGTCPFARQPMFENAFLKVFSDISLPMLNQANAEDAPRRVLCNGSKLPFTRGFDFCLMIYDTFNHLTEEEDILNCFKELNRVLDKGGHFLFDVTTEYNSTQYFFDTVDFEEKDDISIIRESFYNEEKKIQHNLFTYFIKTTGGDFKRFKEFHMQKIYSRDKILELIDKSPLRLEASYDGCTLKPPRNKSERIHFLLKK